MRWAEFLLLLIPLALGLLWWFGPRHLSRRAVVGALLLLAGYGAFLLHMGVGRAVIGSYHPARLVDGKIVPGGAP